MVLPPTEVALRQQNRKLTRLHRKASNMDDDKLVVQAKEEAQRVADEALEQLSVTSATKQRRRENSRNKKKDEKKKKKKAEKQASSSSSKSHNSVAASSNGSVGSAEIAIQRGFMRAMKEENERDDDDDDDVDVGSQQSGVGFDLTTITEAETDERSGRKKKKKKKSRSFLNKLFAKKSVSSKINPVDRSALSSTPLLSTRAGIGKECWMCGCCGKVFATFNIADEHERKCIQTIVDGLDPTSLAATGEDDNESKHMEDEADRKPPAKPLGFPKEVLQTMASSSSSALQQEQNQSMTPAFAAARATFLNDSKQAASIPLTPANKRNGKMKRAGDRALLVDVGMQDTSEGSRQTSIYASATSLQPGMTSPWESTKKGFSSEMVVDNLRNNLTSPGISRVSFRADSVPSKMQLGSPTSMLSQRVTPRRRLTSSFDRSSDNDDEPLDILLTRSMRHQIIMTDEALVNSVKRASEIVLTAPEMDAEKDLGYLSIDKQYYDDMALRASKFKAHPMSKFRTDGDNACCKIQNKFVDAWQLIKEGDKETEIFRDQYEKKNRGNDGSSKELVHDSNTYYVNVVVRHSVKVVNNEIERLAGNRWKDQGSAEGEVVNDNFEQFRKFAHVNLIKLAKLALSVDFTPRKVSIQLSNDLYRLMAPQLKGRGVIIETEIEYRVGPYFVLAVNIKSIQWSKLIKYSHRVVTKRYKQWIADQDRRDELREELAIEEGLPVRGRVNNGGVRGLVMYLGRLFLLTKIELLAQFLSWMYYVHWTISTPLCMIIYRLFMRSTTRKYILTSVADEIFSYVEEKGMEMEIGIVEAEKQAAFMLSALREVRDGSKALKKQKGEPEDKGVIVGPLLGPAIKSDKGPAPAPPADFEMPENLDMVNFEIDLPVGFKRIRWAMLSPKASFLRDALFAESKYENIILDDWSRHNEAIGAPTLPDGVKEEDIVGAERESQYLMPKSGFVGANTAYDTMIITAYNDYCFCVKKRTLSPEVPYGSTFVTWTQMIFTNTGNGSCHLVCSVEAEFPNGPPMISGQIKSGMRAGTAVSFVLMGEIMIRYAEEFP